MMLIDEMAALGQLGPLEDAFGLVRGYGVQIAGIFQDMSQIKTLYKERWESFVANAGVVQFFAPNDKTTAEWMSWRSGQTTAVVRGESENTGSGPGGDSSGRSATWSQMARNYDLPHELMGMAEGTGLLWFAGMSDSNPFFAPFYKDIGQCARRASLNPYDVS
jgi:type IV secretion system protein VirD4